MKPPHEFKVLSVRECGPPGQLILTPLEAADYWRGNIPKSDWFDPAKEAFVVLVLNTRRRILGHNLVGLGSLDSCGVHAREVFRPAIVRAGAVVVLMHNHPSGDPTPSESDIKITRDLIRAGQLLRIEVLDHVIIGETHLSLKELGYFAWS
jgi:DNA repair protein RadC